MPSLRASLLAGPLLVAGGLPACAGQADPVQQGPRNAPQLAPAFPEQTRAPASDSGLGLEVAELASGLEHPWGMAILPDGNILVTERPGRLRVVAPDGTVSPPVAGLPAVHAEGQGGLLDVALGPGFAADRAVYWTYAKPLGDGTSATAAARGRLSEDLTRVDGVTDIFVQAPASRSPMHYGSRIVFDPEGHAFITTGERSAPAERILAQDLGTTRGKVVRLDPDGAVPPDNPFVGTAGAVESIWSFGHRNVQGAAIHPESGALWTVEHGPRGGDELNLTAPGLNFGWPLVSYGVNYDGSPVGRGTAAADGTAQPVYFWDPVIAPSGMAFYDGALFDGWRGDLLIASLNPGGLVRLDLRGADEPGDGSAQIPRIVGEERLLNGVGRVRDVAIAPDGAVLVLTDSRNGALLRLTPAEATN